MPLEFEVVDISFPNVTGRQEKTSVVSFSSAVNKVETAVRGFIFDFVTGDHSIDKVQVDTRRLDVSGNNVVVEAIVNYADINRDDAYSAIVRVLVIAEV